MAARDSANACRGSATDALELAAAGAGDPDRLARDDGQRRDHEQRGQHRGLDPEAAEAWATAWGSAGATFERAAQDAEDGGDSGAIVGPETRAKMSLAGFSRAPDSLEARLSKSQGQSRRWSSMDARKRHSQIQAVSQARPEVRAKRSVKQKERYADPAERAKQSFRMKLQYADPVERARLLEMSILRWKDPESRARESARMRARYASQEERDKQSVRQVLRFADPIKRAEHGVAIRKALKAKKALEHLVEDEPGLAETT